MKQEKTNYQRPRFRTPILILCLCLASLVGAQDTTRSGYPYFLLGVRGGVSRTDMVYSYAGFDRYNHHATYHPLVALTSQVMFGPHLSLRPEVTLTSRGDSLSWLDVGYRLTAHYVDLRLPLTYNFRFGRGIVSPYLMVAPEARLTYGGTISYHADDYPDGSYADISRADWGLTLGGGVDVALPTQRPLWLSVEAGYSLGLANTFSPMETDNSAVIHNPFFGAFMNRGERHSRGVEVSLRLTLPIGDYYQPRRKQLAQTRIDTLRIYRTDTVEIHRTDTIRLQQDTVVQTVRVNDGLNYVKKDCYSFAEMYSFITLGADISDKRICMHINFDFDSYQIRDDDQLQLDDVVLMMKTYPEMIIQVSGHTDSIGTADYNQTLSEQRADAVVRYLAAQGIKANRIQAFGYGLRQPIDSNSTPEGRFNNRRVEFDIIKIGPRRK